MLLRPDGAARHQQAYEQEASQLFIVAGLDLQPPHASATERQRYAIVGCRVRPWSPVDGAGLVGGFPSIRDLRPQR